jgi:hypothetical protein
MAQNRGNRPTRNPMSESLVRDAKPDALVTLWRGCPLAAAQAMTAAMSAGGVVANAGTAAPSEDQAKKQAGGFSIPGFTASDRLPEFTTDTTLGFLRVSEAIVVVSILRRYLTKGSGVEGGWVALPSAPLQVIEFMQTGVQPGGRPRPSGD